MPAEKDVELNNILEAVRETQKTAGYKYIKDALSSMITASAQEVINSAGLDNEAIEKRLKAAGRIEAANMILNMENDIKQQLAAKKVQEEVAKDNEV